MRLTADTNVLVRVLMEDNPCQTRFAQAVLAEAELIALPLVALCECAWVLRSLYRVPRSAIARSIRVLIEPANVSVNRPAVEAGLRQLDAGGDFADGVITYEGEWLGGSDFVSFDRQAVRLAKLQGYQARLLG